MATINIKYNPSLSVFFKSDGKLIVGDNNGNYGVGNENGWGGYNPPKNSITEATIVLTSQSNGDIYMLSGSVNTLDLLAEGLYTTTNQLLLDASIYTDIINTYTLETRENNSPQFEQGVFSITFVIRGQYTYNGDTINWGSYFYDSSIYIVDIINTNSSCIEDILKNTSFAKRCKQNKKFSNLNMYLNMLYEFHNYNILSPVLATDALQRVVKVSDILTEIQGLCNGKNNCKC